MAILIPFPGKIVTARSSEPTLATFTAPPWDCDHEMLQSESDRGHPAGNS
jgi:hypothetical protein